MSFSDWNAFSKVTEFSGVTFRWHPERLEAVADGTTIPLYDECQFGAFISMI